ncbi:MerR family transcriptional regulator [Streptomyces sp. WAC06614]|uniref:MerR family transcriptional regulator n=1 Tax=Streptomyces sp. WAC06614 TaxID=2487416 RepID=UPI000F7B3ED5|nr:MerR family transcriptional regulator [Streptomyces sp. WAC06614]RSS78791.1 MerR family transcriptional regulator [Streptomyces sp. WAC06614]
MSENLNIGEAAALTGTTPRTLRHYQDLGLLPEREDYGFADVVRILWVRRMVERGTALDDVRAALGRRTDHEELLAELEASLAGQEGELHARRAALARLRAARGNLAELAARLAQHGGTAEEAEAPGAGGAAGAAELERSAHPLGPAVAAHEAVTRHVLAVHPRLRAEQRRLQTELMELAGAPADDPRVERLAHAYFVHIQAMEAAERAASFPEPEFVDEGCGPTAVPPSTTGTPHPREPEPDAALAPVEQISPAQARCAELLGRLIAKWASDQG